MIEDNIPAYNARRQWIFTIVGLGALCLLLWLPFGVNHVGLVEEWTIYKTHAAGGFVPEGVAINRLGQMIATYIAFSLTPGSFVALYLFVIGLTFLKGLLLFAVLKRLLRNSAALAFAIAFFWTIYPADTGLFYTRTVSYQLLLVTYLLALWALLRWWDTSRRIYVPIIWLCQLICLLTYEAAFPLVFVTPIVIFWLERKFSRRVVRFAAVWFVVPIILFVGVGLLFLGHRLVYLSNPDESNLGDTSPALAVFLSIVYMYLQHFAFGWILALASPLNIIYKLLAGMVGLLAGIFTYIQTRTMQNYHVPHLRRWAHSGLAIMGLGYIAFMISPNHRELMDRVFLLPSIGAAITLVIAVWSLVLYLPAKRRRVVFSVLVGVLVGWAALWAYERQVATVKYSDIETKILSGIAEQMPGWSAEHPVVMLFDRTGTLVSGDVIAAFGNLAIFDSAEMKFSANRTSEHFQDAVRFMYDSNTIDAFFCYPDTMVKRLEHEQCELQANGLMFRGNSVGPHTYTYDEIVAFEYTGDLTLLRTLALPDGQAVADYHPEQVINASASLPHRYFTLFGR